GRRGRLRAERKAGLVPSVLAQREAAAAIRRLHAVRRQRTGSVQQQRVLLAAVVRSSFELTAEQPEESHVPTIAPHSLHRVRDHVDLGGSALGGGGSRGRRGTVQIP